VNINPEMKIIPRELKKKDKKNVLVEEGVRKGRSKTYWGERRRLPLILGKWDGNQGRDT